MLLNVIIKILCFFTDRLFKQELLQTYDSFHLAKLVVEEPHPFLWENHQLLLRHIQLLIQQHRPDFVTQLHLKLQKLQRASPDHSCNHF